MRLKRPAPIALARAAGPSLTTLLQALPDFILAGSFLLTWIDPGFVSDGAFLYLFTVVGLEMAAINSGGFLLYAYLGFGRVGAAVCILLLGGLFYVAADAIEVMTGDDWAYVAILFLTINRLKLVLFNPRSARTGFQIARQWLVPFGLLMGALFTAALLPLPELGMPNPAVYSTPSGEEMVFDDGHVLLAAGLLYYVGQGLLDLYQPAWLVR